MYKMFLGGHLEVSQLEHLREKLYMAIESGNNEDILRASQELDKHIIKHMKDIPIFRKSRLTA